MPKLSAAAAAAKLQALNLKKPNFKAVATLAFAGMPMTMLDSLHSFAASLPIDQTLFSTAHWSQTAGYEILEALNAVSSRRLLELSICIRAEAPRARVDVPLNQLQCLPSARPLSFSGGRGGREEVLRGQVLLNLF